MPRTTTSYRQTLNLPRTPFAMRAGLTANEPKSIARWDDQRIYERILAARADAEPFAFHDGPPYASGPLHVGHLLNKVLKDLVVRSRLMAGRRCGFVPGWDCHGLPIEHKVARDLVDSGEMERLNRLDEDERRMGIRRRCAAYARRFVELQAQQMKRLLTLADYENPYVTLDPAYEQGVLEVFAGLVEQGLVYRALKSVHWSIENRTALAEAELEYEQRSDTAVFVNFEATDRDAVAAAFGTALDDTPSFMIWTTTPWTLPANLAVAVHERFRYALVRLDGAPTVIAAERVDAVAGDLGRDAVVVAEAEGSALVGLTYRQPLTDRVCPVVKADYVTLTEGTGLVHTAPGHGAEDNLTALREGLEVYCPVRADGTYDDTVPEWLRGMSIWDAQAKIVDHLRRSGNLLHDHPITHSYPHDWRSKTPVIFRATEQWFVAVDRPTAHGGRTLRELAVEACDSSVSFLPRWGRNRMRGMLETRPDWCLSRQRAWGLPIPAFELPDGGVLLTAASVRAVASVFARRGSDAWFTEPPESLLADYDPAADPDAPDALRQADLARLRKMRDIFDVWFESGSSWHAVMRRRGLGYPADLYLEGSDQHRGWFQLSLLPAVGVTGQAPFRALLTHGFTVTKDARKMSKSLGNTINVEDLLATYGADVCRWWVSSLAYENDVKMDLAFFDLAGDTYRKVRNTLRFLLGNLSDYRPDDAAEPPAVDAASIHAWVLDRAAAVQRDVLAAYQGCAFRRAHQALYGFCNETLSAFYCDAVKDRLYCDRPDAPRRRAAQAVMWDLAGRLCRLLAPILPHTADEAWTALWEGKGAAGSVHLETFTEPPQVELDPQWPQLVELRDTVLKALEQAKAAPPDASSGKADEAPGIDNPLDAGVVLPDPDDRWARFDAELPDVFGVSRVERCRDGQAVEIVDLRGEPRCDRCWRRAASCATRADGGTLCDRCADAI